MRPAPDTHRPRLLRVASRLLGSQAAAEDAVQEVYLRLHSEASAPPQPEAWLLMVLNRLCIDLLRQRASEHRREQAFWQWLQLQQPALQAEAELQAELGLALGQALQGLSALERSAWLLREVFELDYAELAGRLGLSPAACRQLVHRVRERVRQRASRDDERAPRDPALQALVAQCLRAIRQANQQALMQALQPPTHAKRTQARALAWVPRADGTGQLRLGNAVLATLPLELFWLSCESLPA